MKFGCEAAWCLWMGSGRKRSDSCSVCLLCATPLAPFLYFKGTPSPKIDLKEEPPFVVRADVKEFHPSSHPFGPLRWTR